MTNRFLISVAAAALIAGTGFANAQGMSREGGGAAGGGSTVQQSAPSERGSATQKAGETGGMKGAQTDQKAPGAAKSQQAEDSLKGQKSPQNTASDTARGGKDMKAEGREGKEGKTVGQAPQSKDSMSKDSAQSKEGMSKDSTTTQSREGMSKDSTTNAQTKSGADRSQTTTGNAATSATAAPPAEKRTQIVSAIKQERIQETTNVNFNISVGATVPATVRFHPIPARVVEIYPEWRGYDVILVHGRYIIVRPQTHEIVFILDV